MRESKREVFREARGLGGAVVHGRWALTDRGGVGRFSDMTLEDCNGPTVTIMAGTWTFDQVTFRVTSKHAWLLCVSDLGMPHLSLFHLCVTSLGMPHLSLFHLASHASSHLFLLTPLSPHTSFSSHPRFLLTPTLTSFLLVCHVSVDRRSWCCSSSLLLLTKALLSCFAHDRHLPCFF
jgi:hypothetical protein